MLHAPSFQGTLCLPTSPFTDLVQPILSLWAMPLPTALCNLLPQTTSVAAFAILRLLLSHLNPLLLPFTSHTLSQRIQVVQWFKVSFEVELSQMKDPAWKPCSITNQVYDIEQLTSLDLGSSYTKWG